MEKIEIGLIDISNPRKQSYEDIENSKRYIEL